MTEAPTQLGSYVVEGEIGRGGMGVVYRARDARLDRRVAIKVLPPEVAGDPERLARFEREARILASLSHPGIAGIYSIEDDGAIRYLALEYVEGPTLADRLAAHALPTAEALDVARQIAAALEAAHEAGVIHRDLKPGNVKITPAGEVKVLDFGLARIEEPFDLPSGASRSPTLTVAATRVGVILGTAAYMSPEQARGRPLDRRTDIWSFGCVLYECLTGRQAFAGETVSDSIAKILERDPDLRLLPADTPARVVELLERCLVKDPRARLRDIGDARLVLDEALRARSASGRFVATATRTAGGRRASRAPIAIAAGAAVLGLALGLALGPRVRPPAARLRSVAIAMPAGETIRGSLVTPDGGTVLVTGLPREGGDAAQLRMMARPIGSDEFQVVPGTEGSLNSLLARDGKSLLLVLPVAPGATQKRLVSLPLDGSAPPTPLADWRDSWNSMTRLDNGDILVADGPTHVARIPRTGGEPSAPVAMKVAGDAKVSQIDLLPSTLPDNRALVNVIVYDSRGWHYRVGVLDPVTGRVDVVVEDGGNAVYWRRTGLLLFARGRSIFAARFDLARHALRGAPAAVWSGLRTNIEARPGTFRVLDDGSLYHAPGGAAAGRRLAVMDAAGAIAPWPGERRSFDDTPVMAPDGHHFACSIANARGIDELWIGDLAGSGLRRLGTDPDADCTQAVWSPDGRSIAYKRQGQDARDGIYVQDLAGGAARRILQPESAQATYRPQAWLPDGSALIVWRLVPGSSSLMRLPWTGGEVAAAQLAPLHETRANEGWPRLSPDARTLAYSSDESGRNEVYLARFQPDGTLGTPVQVSTGGAVLSSWSWDGRSLMLVDSQNRLVQVAVNRDGDAPPAPQVRFDLGKLDIASWTPLPGGRFLVSLRSGDEGDIAYYDLVLGWMDEVERTLKKAR